MQSTGVSIPISEIFKDHPDYRVISYYLSESDNQSVVLVHNCDKAKVYATLINDGWKACEYELAKCNGYNFHYQAQEPTAYIKDDKQIVVLYDLICFSLTPFSIIPLDGSIQKIAWEDPIDSGGCKYINKEVNFVLCIADGVFRRHSFDSDARAFLEDNQQYFSDKNVIRLCRKVFFGYTENLLQQLSEGNYENVYGKYISYSDY